MAAAPVPFNRWGLIVEPEDSAGAYLLVEPEKPDGWKVSPPEDAVRIWRRRPGAADDDDLENWTVWLHEPDLEDWLAGVTFLFPDGAGLAILNGPRRAARVGRSAAVVDVDLALQSQIRNIESTYGRTLQQWFDVIDKSAVTKHNDVVQMLKRDHGMAHGAAHRVSLLARARASGQAAAPAESAAVVDELYSGRRAALRPLHEELMSTVLALGEVEVAPKKGYLSLRRRKQFAMVQPSTATRIDLGLILPKGTRSDDRLESAAGFNALFTHRVRISSSADIDDAVVSLLRAAYDEAR